MTERQSPRRRFIRDDHEFISSMAERAQKVPRDYTKDKNFKRLAVVPDDIERLCHLASIALRYQPKRLRNRKAA